MAQKCASEALSYESSEDGQSYRQGGMIDVFLGLAWFGHPTSSIQLDLTLLEKKQYYSVIAMGQFKLRMGC